MSCPESGEHAGKPILCDLPEGHDDRHYDDIRHVRWERTGSRITGTWEDPLTKMERFFGELPNMHLRESCPCGSGKPVLYWSANGTGCEECKGSLMFYIPDVMMCHVMDRFNFPQELRQAVYDQVNPEEK